MPEADTALALAGQLRSLSDGELAELLRARAIRVSGIADFFDLAEALTDEGSIQDSLARLDRPTLATLAALGDAGTASIESLQQRLVRLGAATDRTAEHLSVARRLALAVEFEGEHAVPSAVAGRLRDWPSLGLPSLTQLASPPPVTLEALEGASSAVVDRSAAENAFTTTTHVAEIVAALDHSPARELARGGIALPDAKRLSAAAGVGLDDLPPLIRTAQRAGLLAFEAGELLPTPQSAEWLIADASERWARLATAWVDRLPAELHEVLASRAHTPWGDRLGRYLTWLFPADPGMPERARAASLDATALGIVATSIPSTPGAALLADGVDAAAAAMRTLFPSTVDRVYLQHDLTVVSPGPLEPRLDARLRTMADVEGRSLAATYRISTASLNRALAGGATEQGVRDFLSSISLTGMPQPLEYLITESAERYGLVRVRTDGTGSRVRSSDVTMLRTISVDSTLAPLALARSGDDLVSRLSIDTVFWALSDAKYPIAAEDDDGQVIVLRQHRAHSAPPPEADPVAALVERLRLSEPDDPEVARTAWLARQLDAAVRGKHTLEVTVRMPDGSTVDLELEPTSVAAGRLRARDKLRDLERTLPLSSIVAVAPVGH